MNLPHNLRLFGGPRVVPNLSEPNWSLLLAQLSSSRNSTPHETIHRLIFFGYYFKFDMKYSYIVLIFGNFLIVLICPFNRRLAFRNNLFISRLIGKMTKSPENIAPLSRSAAVTGGLSLIQDSTRAPQALSRREDDDSIPVGNVPPNMEFRNSPHSQ
jgi:hypothetical protein